MSKWLNDSGISIKSQHFCYHAFNVGGKVVRTSCCCHPVSFSTFYNYDITLA